MPPSPRGTVATSHGQMHGESETPKKVCVCVCMYIFFVVAVPPKTTTGSL